MEHVDLNKLVWEEIPEETRYYGLYATRIKELTRKETLKYAFAIRAIQQGIEDAPFLSVSFPCGEEMECDTLNDVPLVDVPCPCGNPKHWLIKWEEPNEC